MIADRFSDLIDVGRFYSTDGKGPFAFLYKLIFGRG